MIYFPKVYGTCSGADKAIQMAYKLKEENQDKNIFIYKEILHNNYILDELEKNGIKTIYNYDNLTPNDILIIRAHGEGKKVFDDLNKKNITYYDATCINVRKVHKLVESKYNDNYNIIIVGKKNHPEVIGTNGWCDDTATIIENINDLVNLDKNKKYYMVSQTTIGLDLFNVVIDYLKNNNYDFEYDNTICNVQKAIQTSSVELAKKMDIMFIIGGKNSSNTKELYNLCKKECNSYFFDDISDFYNFIKNEYYTEKTKIGFTGGASTLKTQIYDFSHLLEYIISNKINVIKLKKNKFF